MAGVVASQTVVFTDAVGAQTSCIRTGGCVLLPHYSPLLTLSKEGMCAPSI